MNLTDVVDINLGIVEDSWSQSDPRFEGYPELRVVGWSLKNKKGEKLYVLHCSKCSEDSELFGDGYFKSRKSDLKDSIPCGCSTKKLWSKFQYATLCRREAERLGHKFLGFSGEWVGKSTKVRLECSKHGVWESTVISSLLAGRSCKKCSIDLLSESRRKSEEYMIKSFLESESFHPETKFWRSDRKDHKGCSSYWNVYCPECKGFGESMAYNLQKGKRCCGCSQHRQTQGYINFVFDDTNVICIKFGISTVSKRRTRQQNSKSVYRIENHCIFVFEDVVACRKAENTCKQELECGVVLKRDMPDGWSETTWAYNFNRITQIYKENGGILISQNISNQCFELSNNQEVTK